MFKVMKQKTNERHSDNKFYNKFGKEISGILSCPDRIIFKGYLPFNYPSAVESFFYKHKILFKDYKKFIIKQTEIIKSHVENIAQENNCIIQNLNSKTKRKDEIVRDIIKDTNKTEGLICIFSCIEACLTIRTKYGDGKPSFYMHKGKCKVYYIYFFDPKFGLMHVRLQTWFPYIIQIYLNGHDFLAKKFEKEGIKFEKDDNTFTYIEDFEKAQKIANKFVKVNWPVVLEKYAKRVNPLLKSLFRGEQHYWVMDQFELSTDIVFKNKKYFKSLKDKLLKYCLTTLSPTDVLNFFEKSLDIRNMRESRSSFKNDRDFNSRIKFKVRNNWLKLYSKSGCVLRIETIINQAKDFRILSNTKKGKKVKPYWKPMCKGVSNMYRHIEISNKINQNFLSALSVVDSVHEQSEKLLKIGSRKKQNGCSYRPFNPVNKFDILLLKSIFDGRNLLGGITNKNIRISLYGDEENKTKKEISKLRAKTSRLLKILHVHGLIAKIPRTRRWRVTEKGKSIIPAFISVLEERYLKVA